MVIIGRVGGISSLRDGLDPMDSGAVSQSDMSFGQRRYAVGLAQTCRAVFDRARMMRDRDRQEPELDYRFLKKSRGCFFLSPIPEECKP